jgi:hypothetical protein
VRHDQPQFGVNVGSVTETTIDLLELLRAAGAAGRAELITGVEGVQQRLGGLRRAWGQGWCPASPRQKPGTKLRQVGRQHGFRRLFAQQRRVGP